MTGRLPVRQTPETDAESKRRVFMHRLGRR